MRSLYESNDVISFQYVLSHENAQTLDIYLICTLLAILCMQQRFESLYNHIMINRNNLDSEFFYQLASLTSADKMEKWLKGKGISYRTDEYESLQDFLKCFIKVLASNPKADTLSKDVWSRVQEFL